jgi:hypothetical protein
LTSRPSSCRPRLKALPLRRFREQRMDRLEILRRPPPRTLAAMKAYEKEAESLPMAPVCQKNVAARSPYHDSAARGNLLRAKLAQ